MGVTVGEGVGAGVGALHWTHDHEQVFSITHQPGEHAAPSVRYCIGLSIPPSGHRFWYCSRVGVHVVGVGCWRSGEVCDQRVRSKCGRGIEGEYSDNVDPFTIQINEAYQSTRPS